MEKLHLFTTHFYLNLTTGNPLSEEKRWGHAASNSGASNGNNIVLGKKKEEEKRGGQAATNSKQPMEIT